MSNIFQPDRFKDYPNVTATLSLRDSSQPAEYSMLPTNTTQDVVEANHRKLADQLGFENLAVAHQNHTNNVQELAVPYSREASPKADALITNLPGWLLGVTIADCLAILLYDPEHRAIAAVHSGRRGTAHNITGNTVAAMQQSYATDPSQLIAWMSPCPNANEYPLDTETAKEQDERYLSPGPDAETVFYDNRSAVRDQLLAVGLQPDHIQVDERSTFAEQQFHSYRRDHETSGRMLAVIGLK